jgi:Homeodomain-like domain
MTADGVATSAIMETLQTTCPAITRWRQRFVEQGVEGLCKDASRPGRKPRIGEEQVREVVERTLYSTPVHGTHWSTRTMVSATGLSKGDDPAHLADPRTPAAWDRDLQLAAGRRSLGAGPKPANARFQVGEGSDRAAQAAQQPHGGNGIEQHRFRERKGA